MPAPKTNEDKAAATEAKAKAPEYVVAKGKALTTLKGVVSEGQEITEAMLGNSESWKLWLNKKVIVKGSEYVVN